MSPDLVSSVSGSCDFALSYGQATCSTFAFLIKPHKCLAPAFIEPGSVASHRSHNSVSQQYDDHCALLPTNMDHSRTLRPNPSGTGHRDSFNTIGSYNTTYNTTWIDEKLEILRWLSPLDPHVRHQDVSAHRQDGLGNWFLQTQDFIKWSDCEDKSSKATLFCSGNPGVGKTYLR